jgi:Protein of unknown function (DUF1559)
LQHRPGFEPAPDGIDFRPDKSRRRRRDNLPSFTSYAGSDGQWAGQILGQPGATVADFAGNLQQHNGAIVANGVHPRALPNKAAVGASRSRATLASITDGTSNTIAFSEHAHGLLSKTGGFYSWNWWVSGNYGDTAFTEFYPINIQKKAKDDPGGLPTEAGGESLATTFHHCWPEFNRWLDGVLDTRFLPLVILRRLIRMRSLDAARLQGRLVVALDATGHLAFQRRPCPHCLAYRHATHTTYLHQVLEAK